MHKQLSSLLIPVILSLVLFFNVIGLIHAANPPQVINNNAVIKGNLKPEYAKMSLPVSVAVRQGKIFVTWFQDDNKIIPSGYNIYRDNIRLNNNQPVTKKAASQVGNWLKANSPEMQDIAKVLDISPANPEQFFAYNKINLITGKIVLNRDNIRRILRELYAGAAIAMGTGYLDEASLEPGKSYTYTVRPVINGQEVLPGGSVTVTNQDISAQFTLPSASECQIYQGDQSVELLWPVKDQRILAYDIYRGEPGDTDLKNLQKLNQIAVSAIHMVAENAPTGISNNPFINVPPQLPKTSGIKLNQSPGSINAVPAYKRMAFFVDNAMVQNQPANTYKVLHEVKNGHSYRYWIVPRDIMGPTPNPKLRLTLTATAQDRLRPAAPEKLSFKVLTRKWSLPDYHSTTSCCALNCSLCQDNWLYPPAGSEYDVNGIIEVSWVPKAMNINGLPEDLASYKLWRYETQVAAESVKLDDPLSNKGKLIDTYTLTQASQLQNTLKIKDNGPKSETVYWYRLEVVDQAGHANFSGVFATSYQDQIPPLAPTNVRVDNADLKKITIKWDPSRDAENPSIIAPDLGGYRVYRRVCGTVPVRLRDQTTTYAGTGSAKPTSDDVVKGKYKDFFLLVATIPAELGQTEFTDRSLPDDSPYCWEYCVRAYDKSQNVSKDTVSNVTCGRLTKKKGPRAPTITSLQARSNSIQIDWVAPPASDLYTFQIYRLESGDFNNWANWVQVNANPTLTSLKCSDTPPAAPPYASGLDPGNGQPAMHKGATVNTYWFIDTKDVKPNRKYWYKIVSLDHLGNPKHDSEFRWNSTSPMMSTFTYDKYISESLTLHKPTYNEQNGVVLSWNQPQGLTNITFVLYRSNKSADAGFIPLTELKSNTYNDLSARPGTSYWYRVQYVTESGHYSNYSDAVTITIPVNQVLLPF